MMANVRRAGPMLLLLLVFLSPLHAEDRTPARPGTVNYVEGQAYLGIQPLNAKSIGTVELEPGQTLDTQNGKAEILLTPGVFVRLGDNGAARMLSAGLTHTEISIDEGEAFVEVVQIQPENDLRIAEDGISTKLLKTGLYDFNESLHVVRVLDGEALVRDGDQATKIKGGHFVNLEITGTLKAQKFNKKLVEAEDLYRWASLRSGYLAEANADISPIYPNAGLGWFGEGWYWDPWFDAYTFMPGDGIFYSPFGWGFYSPSCAYAAPYFGGRFYPHRFNERYSAFGNHYGLPAHYGRGVRYGPHYGGGIFARGSRGGGVRGGGGFHGSSGFHGGAGGFHGGGGGGHH